MKFNFRIWVCNPLIECSGHLCKPSMNTKAAYNSHIAIYLTNSVVWLKG